MPLRGKKPGTMILYCVRHGESTYNSLGRIQGHLDVPLSERGVRQSQAAAAALAGLSIEVIYASPLRRAFQTAQIIAEILQVQIRTDPRLMEINAGIFQGRTREELLEFCPEALARWTGLRGNLAGGARSVAGGRPRRRHRHGDQVALGGCVFQAAVGRRERLDHPAGVECRWNGRARLAQRSGSPVRRRDGRHRRPAGVAGVGCSVSTEV